MQKQPGLVWQDRFLAESCKKKNLTSSTELETGLEPDRRRSGVSKNSLSLQRLQEVQLGTAHRNSYPACNRHASLCQTQKG